MFKQLGQQPCIGALSQLIKLIYFTSVEKHALATYSNHSQKLLPTFSVLTILKYFRDQEDEVE